MSTVQIDRIFLALHTRDEQDAGSTASVRLFAGTVELANFQTTPPPPGKVRLLEAKVSLGYPEVLDQPFFVGLSGVDTWGPRSAFLWGRASSGSEEYYIPLAENLTAIPYRWVSQDLQQGIDRWPLRRLDYLEYTLPLTGFVLVMETAAAPRVDDARWLFEQAIQRGLESAGVRIHPKSGHQLVTAIENTQFVPLVPIDPGTSGPIELSVYGGGPVLADSGILWSGTQWSRSLIFQSTLTRRGQQDPAASGESYLAYFTPGLLNTRAGAYQAALLTNHSEDPWKPRRIWLFGLGPLNSARLLGMSLGDPAWYGQNPHVSETVTAGQSVLLPKRLFFPIDFD